VLPLLPPPLPLDEPLPPLDVPPLLPLDPPLLLDVPPLLPLDPPLLLDVPPLLPLDPPLLLDVPPLLPLDPPLLLDVPLLLPLDPPLLLDVPLLLLDVPPLLLLDAPPSPPPLAPHVVLTLVESVMSEQPFDHVADEGGISGSVGNLPQSCPGVHVPLASKHGVTSTLAVISSHGMMGCRRE
jgi:hypothetical protein